MTGTKRPSLLLKSNWLTNHPRLAEPSRESGSSGRLLVGGVCLEFPLSIAEADLAKLIRVAGQFS